MIAKNPAKNMGELMRLIEILQSIVSSKVKVEELESDGCELYMLFKGKKAIKIFCKVMIHGKWQIHQIACLPREQQIACVNEEVELDFNQKVLSLGYI